MEEVKQLQWFMHWASGFSPTRSVLNRDTKESEHPSQLKISIISVTGTNRMKGAKNNSLLQRYSPLSTMLQVPGSLLAAYISMATCTAQLLRIRLSFRLLDRKILQSLLLIKLSLSGKKLIITMSPGSPYGQKYCVSIQGTSNKVNLARAMCLQSDYHSRNTIIAFVSVDKTAILTSSQ